MNSVHRTTVAAVFVLMISLATSPRGNAVAPQAGAASGGGSDSSQEETDVRRSKSDLRSPRSIGDRFIATMHSPIGASLSFIELYTPDVSATAGKRSFVSYTMLRPEIFTHTVKKSYEFHFDYTFGYRGNNRHRQIRSSDHLVMLDLTRRLSRRAFLQFSDRFRSVFNDEAVLPQSTSVSPILYQPALAQELYTPNQRFSTNSLITSFSYQAGKRLNMSVFGSYDLWRYSLATFGEAQGFQAGVRGEYRMNKWLYFDSRYSHYLTKVDPRFLPSNIQRIQAGGLKFAPRRGVEFSVSGGVDSTRLEGIQRTTTALQGGISKTSGSTLISLVYYRGFSVAGGPGALLKSDTVNSEFTQWLSRRINLHLNSGYVKGASLVNGSALRYISGTAELEFMLQRHVMFSTQYTYLSQRGAKLGLTSSLLNRYTLSAGFQFFFATTGTRQRGLALE